MTFNIGSQTGGVINNVAGNQTISGGQHGVAVGSREARQAADNLVEALRHSQLQTDAVVMDQTQRIQAEMRTADPDKSKVAACLDKLVNVVSTADAWAKAGAAVVGPIRTLATWLGALGGPILGLLPALI
jgi:hypothetical protein